MATNYSASEAGGTPTGMRTVIAAATTGTAIEWYDFFVYGTVSALVFPKIFFPETDPFVGTLLSLFTFLVGFIARPIGGAVFGHLGDRIGRKSTLIATLMLMGVSTLLVGFLPGYATIGIAAPIILSLLRFCQGLGVGGEWGGSVLLAMEYGHRKNRGYWAAWPQVGVPIGLVISTVIVNIVSRQDNFATFGWRIPFFISALLIIIGMWIRLRVLETPLFQQMKASGQEAKSPLAHAFRNNWVEILLSAGARFVEQAPFYLFTVFVITYALIIKVPKAVVLNGVTFGAIIELGTILLFGYLSDRIGRRLWYLIGCGLMAVFAFPYFAMLNSGDTVIVTLAIILSLALAHAWVYGPQAALIAERFGTRSRYSGASLGYQLAAPFAGGLAPIIALLLLKGKNNLAAMGLKSVEVNIGKGSWQNVAIYMIVLAVISFVSVLGLKELSQADISGADAPTAEAVAVTD